LQDCVFVLKPAITIEIEFDGKCENSLVIGDPFPTALPVKFLGMPLCYDQALAD